VRLKLRSRRKLDRDSSCKKRSRNPRRRRNRLHRLQSHYVMKDPLLSDRSGVAEEGNRGTH